MERTKIHINTADVSAINDKNGDGMGEFEGWGTSLCWWANRVGYSDKMTRDATEKFYGKEGLRLNIGRYNVGGGDHVADEVPKVKDPDDEFLHKTHITRSDSVVPGYACNVTKIRLDKHDKEWYDKNFTRADFECGYAWDYDWDADKRQMNVLLAAAKAAGDEFIAEAFSNSPPYFMTVSGCSSGNVDPNEDNLRKDSYKAFATYMADVIEHWGKAGVVKFQSADPMNEPFTDYWHAFSDKQEGCHFDLGESQSRILVEFKKALKERNVDMILCGADENNIDVVCEGYEKLSDEAKEALDRIDVHSYEGSKREDVRRLAEKVGKNLWMSEVDGAGVDGEDAGEMGAPLWLGNYIEKDLKGFRSSAWILWDIVDVHVDKKSFVPFEQRNVSEMRELLGLNKGGSLWGLTIGDHDHGEIALTMKYYGFGQYTRYIRPGMTLMGSDEGTLVYHDPVKRQTVIVARNTKKEDRNVAFDLSGFTEIGRKAKAVRTSGALLDGEKWADVTEDSVEGFDEKENCLYASLKGNSITTFIIEGCVR